MGPEEFDAMQSSGAVQLSRFGVTHVAFPADAETFVSRGVPAPATRSSIFLLSAYKSSVKRGCARIIGPGAGDIYNTLRDAIGPNNVQFPGRDPGIIESRIPSSYFERVLAAHEPDL